MEAPLAWFETKKKEASDWLAKQPPHTEVALAAAGGAAQGARVGGQRRPTRARASARRARPTSLRCPFARRWRYRRRNGDIREHGATAHAGRARASKGAANHSVLRPLERPLAAARAAASRRHAGSPPAPSQPPGMQGGPLVLGRNFAVMTGVNAGLTCLIKKMRNGVEDVQGRRGPPPT